MKKIFILFICLSAFYAYSQYAEEDVRNYIKNYSDLAVQAMKTYKIPASVKLAQAIYSSNAGQSKVAKEANNHFGLLCNAEYQGEQYYETSDRSGNCYRMYSTVKESFQDHNIFLTTRERYASLFQLSSTDYTGWANGLQACGYSINPEYGQRLISIIEKYQLDRFDNPGEASKEKQSSKTNLAKEEPKTEAVQQAKVSQKGNEPDTVINGIEIYIQRDGKTSKAAEKSNKPIISMNVFTAKANEYRVSYFPYTKRDVYENNKIKFVIAQRGDTYAKIAKATQLQESDLRLFNDAYDEYEPIENEVVYLQMKNTKSDVSYHKLEMADSFRYLSQKYAIQLKLLTKRNQQPAEGFTVGSLICIDCKK